MKFYLKRKNNYQGPRIGWLIVVNRHPFTSKKLLLDTPYSRGPWYTSSFCRAFEICSSHIYHGDEFLFPCCDHLHTAQNSHASPRQPTDIVTPPPQESGRNRGRETVAWKHMLQHGSWLAPCKTCQKPIRHQWLLFHHVE